MLVSPQLKTYPQSTNLNIAAGTGTNNDGTEESRPVIMLHEASGVIFDIDGTLADSWKLGFDATQQVVPKNQNNPLITEEL